MSTDTIELERHSAHISFFCRVHYQQGYVWRELSRYGIAHDLKYTPNADYPDRGYAVSQFEGEWTAMYIDKSSESSDILPRS